MTKYLLQDTVIAQRNARIPEGLTICAHLLGLDTGEDFDHSGHFIALSYQGTVYVLNLTASIILEELLRETPKEEIAAQITEVFSVSEGQAREDVGRHIEELKSLGILIEA
jgi:hypothetical protein